MHGVTRARYRRAAHDAYGTPQSGNNISKENVLDTKITDSFDPYIEDILQL